MPDTLESIARKIGISPPVHWEQDSMGSTTGEWVCSYCGVEAVAGSRHDSDCLLLRFQRVLEEVD